MNTSELFYQLSQLLLHPILWAIYLSFVYSLLESGRFFAAWFMRLKSRDQFQQFKQADTKALTSQALAAYPVARFFTEQKNTNLNDIEVFALKKLEFVRLVTRITPMLGLIATLIPMGPALVAMTENNIVAMSEHLRTAFTAVVLALAAASFTFWIASVKKRWFAEEIVVVEKHITDKQA